jgi:aminoglycoside phosphotransferase (APT) family kinase protein
MLVPGRLIASGRDADIFEFGDGRVLRRSRKGRSLAVEARTMEFVRSRGYPVPEVFDLSDDGCDLVMERIDGPTMVEAAGARPWQIPAIGKELAELHRSLHQLLAPGWLPDAPCGSGDRLLHMDLHPLNVIQAPSGPVVIDWTNAARGDPLVDVALAWALIASGDVPAGRLKSVVVRIGRTRLLRGFLEPFDEHDLGPTLAAVVEWKCTDPNMNEGEVSRMRSLL